MASKGATSNSSTSVAHYTSDHIDLVNNNDRSSTDLTKRFAQMQLKSAACTPKRQPTIVCEEIADDVDDDGDDDDDDDKQHNLQITEPTQITDIAATTTVDGLLRSASSASLSVPIICENEIIEKRRPPLPETVAINH